MQYLSQGLPIAIIGYVMVFVVLCFLWFVLELMRVIMSPKKQEKKVESITQNPTPVAPVENTITIEEQVDESELVAVLTAAVAASLNTSTYNLKIKSFKRIDTINNAWANASRNDAINNY